MSAGRNPTVSPDPAIVDAFAREVRRAKSVLFITGAGVSADSGLPTYRGVGGLYERKHTDEGIPIEVVLSGPMMERHPGLTWKYIYQIESACRGARPNPAHHVIAALEDRIDRLWVLTQNVDGLHRKAGSRRVIEIHGSLSVLRCTACAWKKDVEDLAHVEAELGTPEQPLAPACPECGMVVRPDVVLFEEMLPPQAIATVTRELQTGFDLIVSVGTSSAFPYIAAPVVSAQRAGAVTIEVNPARTEVSSLVDLKIPAGAAATFEGLWDRLDRG